MRKYIFLVFAVLTANTSYCCADLVCLKNGKTIEGEVISETKEKVSIRLPLGPGGDMVYTLERSGIDSIKEAPFSFDGESAPEEAAPVVTGNEFSINNSIQKAIKMLSFENLDSTAIKKIIGRVKGYMSSSVFAEVIADFILAFLALSALSLLRKDPQTASGMIRARTSLCALARWAVFVIGMAIVQLQRFGTFDVMNSGIVPFFIVTAVLYVTLEVLILSFLKMGYVKLIAAGGLTNFIIFRMPITVEFTLFSYLFLIDILRLFL